MFRDRTEAGEKLAEALAQYQGADNVVVVALPRGGVVPGRIIADALSAPLDIVVPRKIGFPGNPEYAIGAITEHGESIFNEQERMRVDSAYLKETQEKEQQEAKRRLRVYREGMGERSFKGKTVIVVDDGVATGLTMQAAIASLKAQGAQKVVVAVPIGAPDSMATLRQQADDVVVLDEPQLFMAIGQFYREFPQVSDEEVLQLLQG